MKTFSLPTGPQTDLPRLPMGFLTGLLTTLLTCLLAGLPTASVVAQAPEEEEESSKSEFAYGINLNTNAGLLGGIVLRNSRKINSRMYHYFYLEIVDVKDPRELRIQQQVNSYINQKQNFFYAIRPQYGREVVLFRKAAEQGVQVNGIVAAGPTLGLLKPYYVLTQQGSVPYRSGGSQNILGAGNFGDGFGEMQPRLGASLKLGASFELGTFRSSLTGFEVGWLVEAFTQPVPILDPASTGKPRQVFTSGYLNIFFGSRR